MSNLPQVQKQIGSIKKMLDAPSLMKRLATALPKNLGITPDYLKSVFITQISEAPDLANCTEISLAKALIRSAELALQPGSALGLCYLIPFNNRKLGVKEAVLMIGYRGMIDIVRRSGTVKSCSAEVVYEKDDFDYYMDETGEKIKHRKSRLSAKKRGEITDVYFVVWFVNGGVDITHMTAEQVENIRKKHSKGGNFWTDHKEEMYKKTAIRRAFKTLPASIVKQASEQVQDEYDFESQFDGDIIEVDYAEAPEDDLKPGKRSPRENKKETKKEAEKPSQEERDLANQMPDYEAPREENPVDNPLLD